LYLVPLKISVVSPGEDLLEPILEALKRNGLELRDGDLLAVSSKVVSIAQNRIVKLEDVKPRDEAFRLAERHGLDPSFAEIVLREADRILGGARGALLTLKDGMLTANAGVDQKNAPSGYAVLPPKDPASFSRKVRFELFNRTGRRVAVMIVDSRVTPLRMGTVGYALAVSGFKPVVDLRFKRDLFGRSVRITRHSVADDLSSAAHVLMGETDEKVAVVLIRDAPIELIDEEFDISMNINPDECLFMASFLKNLRNLEKVKKAL